MAAGPLRTWGHTVHPGQGAAYVPELKEQGQVGGQDQLATRRVGSLLCSRRTDVRVCHVPRCSETGLVGVCTRAPVSYPPPLTQLFNFLKSFGLCFLSFFFFFVDTITNVQKSWKNNTNNFFLLKIFAVVNKLLHPETFSVPPNPGHCPPSTGRGPTRGPSTRAGAR